MNDLDDEHGIDNLPENQVPQDWYPEYIRTSLACLERGMTSADQTCAVLYSAHHIDTDQRDRITAACINTEKNRILLRSIESKPDAIQCLFHALREDGQGFLVKKVIRDGNARLQNDNVKCPFRFIGCKYEPSDQNDERGLVEHEKAATSEHITLLLKKDEERDLRMDKLQRQCDLLEQRVRQPSHQQIPARLQSDDGSANRQPGPRPPLASQVSGPRPPLASQLSGPRPPLASQLSEGSAACAPPVRCRQTGKLNWKLTKFAEKMRPGDQNPRSIFSPPFYSENGYKMSLRVDPNGFGDAQGHISIYLHLEPGEFDHRLSWPFKESVYISLIDPFGRGEHEIYKIHAGTSRDPTKCWGRPEGNKRNQGRGKGNFLPHTRLQRYLKEDTLWFEVTVGSPPRTPSMP